MRSSSVALTMALAGAVLLTGAPELSAQIQETDPLPPESAADSLTARLEQLKVRIAENPRDSETRLARLRVQYALSVSDEDYMERALNEIERIQVLGGDAGVGNLLDGYVGALRVISGKHAFWPHQKYSRVNEGLKTLDACVAAEPEHLELRYLRLVSTHYLPFFFGRGDSAAEDLEMVVQLLGGDLSEVPADVLVPAVDFVLQHAELGRDARDRLARLLDGARVRVQEP